MTDSGALRAHLVQTLARRLRIPAERIDPTEPLTRYGLDSLEAQEVMAVMERYLGVAVPDDLPFEHPTVAELTIALEALAARTT